MWVVYHGDFNNPKPRGRLIKRWWDQKREDTVLPLPTMEEISWEWGQEDVQMVVKW